ncbi:hypothetical protein MKW92_042501 [Papaver armeniacum]|nr:hypothetical protein MKW92_042501 [Papaver armeniacum]
MPVLTYTDEFACSVAPHRLFHGLFMDAHNLIPKIMPVVKSVDFVSGDGGPGSIQQVNFVDGYQMKYLKNRLDFKDKENCAINYTIDCISNEVKFDAAPGGGSKYVVLDEETMKAGKEGHMQQYKVCYSSSY